LNIPPPESIAAIAIVIFFAIGLHEYAHCKFADMAGDPTPRFYGRVTLNLTKHFELMGTLMIALTSITGYGIGWGKASPMDASKMRNPRWDLFVAVAAGPISNLLQAVVWAFVARLLYATNHFSGEMLGKPDNFVGSLLWFGVLINISLAFFNLFPIPPLDGHWLFGLLLPQPAQDRWFLYSRRYGWQVLIALVLIGQIEPTLSVFRLASPLIGGIAIYLFGPLAPQ
jgi:Zn-dependent protease